MRDRGRIRVTSPRSEEGGPGRLTVSAGLVFFSEWCFYVILKFYLNFWKYKVTEDEFRTVPTTGLARTLALLASRPSFCATEVRRSLPVLHQDTGTLGGACPLGPHQLWGAALTPWARPGWPAGRGQCRAHRPPCLSWASVTTPGPHSRPSRRRPSSLSGGA